MRNKREYADYLHDIAEYSGKVLFFIEGCEFEAFKSNDEKVLAVLHALEIIGEATKKIPANLKNKYPDIPWKAISGMRDKIIHEYFGMDLEVVWGTLKKDLPILRQVVEKMLREIGE